MMQEQIRNLGKKTGIDQNPLKILDEYYYCKYTKNGFEGDVFITGSVKVLTLTKTRSSI